MKSSPNAETFLCRPRIRSVRFSGSAQCCRRAWVTTFLWESVAGKRITSGQLVEVDPDRLESVAPEILTRLQKGPDQVHSTSTHLHEHAHPQALVTMSPLDANSALLCLICQTETDCHPQSRLHQFPAGLATIIFLAGFASARFCVCMQCFHLRRINSPSALDNRFRM